MKNPCEILGLSTTYTDKDLEHAKKRLCKLYHPDSGGSAEKFNEVIQAYETLKKGSYIEVSTKGTGYLRHKNLFEYYIMRE